MNITLRGVPGPDTFPETHTEDSEQDLYKSGGIFLQHFRIYLILVERRGAREIFLINNSVSRGARQSY